MANQKQLWGLVAYELKVTPVNQLLRQLFMAAIIAFFFGFFIDRDIKNWGAVIADLVLCIFVMFYPYSGRLQIFRVVKIKSHLYANAFYVQASMLPIKQEVLLASRLILSFFYTFLTAVVGVSGAFLLPNSNPLFSELSLGQSVAFILLWALIAASAGAFLAAGDVGGKYSIKQLINYNVLLYSSVIILFAALHFFTGKGLVGWSFDIVTNAPFLSVCIALLVFLISNVLAFLEAKRLAKKVDYHV
ncbi:MULTISPECIES: hypothetical protein [Bacillus]|uniref:ABC transporter permease n=2 Tax=Bacillus TaxID=1386 RepID=A0A0M3R921_9BACI|nr:MULTISPECIES: hypothetical protein [Bacillus]ALC80666.1 hypothetical protein AM592_02995 [Bacillus gobiensis]MBP1079555.1 hypothetical protein [Bacillus capparidis]MED1094956.1 hypothetical protein [Bacillus capparidis]